MDLPFIKPVWSLFIMLSNTVLILLAIIPDASLYTVSRRVNGLQFLKKNLWFIVFWDASNNALFLSYV